MGEIGTQMFQLSLSICWIHDFQPYTPIQYNYRVKGQFRFNSRSMNLTLVIFRQVLNRYPHSHEG